jgi:hypothetical protein
VIASWAACNRQKNFAWSQFGGRGLGGPPPGSATAADRQFVTAISIVDASAGDHSGIFPDPAHLGGGDL